MGMQVGGSQGGDGLNSEINVTPFVDVMLVLLVIFMITAPMLNTGVDITLPQIAAQNIEDPEGKLILSIDKNQRLLLGKSPVQWAELSDKLSTNRRVQTEKELYIEAEQSLPYGVVVTAMATAKSAGVERVMMLTDPSEQLDLSELDRAVGNAAPTE
ncbi:ExbD/TolR family protein [Haliangium ochraceum]|uniref:Biopolymer transport protein ExbD/TolR n=1 Tax=Haliangium ochraceum (strain DSM 14365 / JCM 11303 / SMP-2) TaxID=502025 RepID=D0LGN0_HALO1|nr:ExbD/TolR family protein [Haliangium ochraceum]ACY12776.1 Biopolymer transport protein ExbD/TolR [Haliangium ochraceum DSM 14365]